MRNKSRSQYWSGLLVILIAVSAMTLILAGCTGTTRAVYGADDSASTSYVRAVYTLGYSGMMSGQLWKDRPMFR
jgi:hypothetical protein